MSLNGNDQERHFATAHGATHVPTLADDIQQVFSAFATRWRMIFITICVFLFGGIFVMWTAEPVYTSTVEILVDPRVLQLIKKEVVPTGLGSSSEGADVALVASQLEILKSRSVLTALIEQENLEENSEFSGGGGSGGLSGLLKSIFYGPNLKNYTGLSNFDQVLESVLKAMTVDRIGDSYIMSITFGTANPQLSARLANAVADIYVKQWATSNATSTEGVAVVLEERLEALREEAQASQQAVEDYRRENGLISSEGVIVSEQQIKDLNTQVTAAGVALETAKTYLDEVERAFLSRGGGTSSSSVLTSDALVTLRTELTAARAAEARARSVYGARHPVLVSAIDTLRVLEEAFRDELARIRERARLSYNSAKQQETALFTRLQQQQARQGDVNNASVKLNELVQNATADQQLYQLFLTRAKEAREQVSLPTNTVRIISVAKPSTKPSEPKLSIVLVTSVFLGGLVGAAIAWISHILNGSRKMSFSVPKFKRPVFMKHVHEQPVHAESLQPVDKGHGSPISDRPLRTSHVQSTQHAAQDRVEFPTPGPVANTYRPRNTTPTAQQNSSATQGHRPSAVDRRNTYQPRTVRR